MRRSALAVAGLRVAGCATLPTRADTQPWFEISLAQWSYNRQLRGMAEPKMDNLEFPARTRALGIDAVEFVNQFFMDKARDRKYLQQLKTRCDDADVRALLIMCDREGNLGDPDNNKRTTAVENHHKWVDAARYLGCHSIRVNAASRGTWAEQRKLAADGLLRITRPGRAASC